MTAARNRERARRPCFGEWMFYICYCCTHRTALLYLTTSHIPSVFTVEYAQNNDSKHSVHSVGPNTPTRSHPFFCQSRARKNTTISISSLIWNGVMRYTMSHTATAPPPHPLVSTHANRIGGSHRTSHRSDLSLLGVIWYPPRPHARSTRLEIRKYDYHRRPAYVCAALSRLSRS